MNHDSLLRIGAPKSQESAQISGPTERGTRESRETWGFLRIGCASLQQYEGFLPGPGAIDRGGAPHQVKC